jgi:hypothetical protein
MHDKGFGPFSFMVDGMWGTLDKWGCMTPPAVYEDIQAYNEVPDRDSYYCGFLDEDQMFSWFDPNCIEEIITRFGDSYGLYEYEVRDEDVLIGEYQIAFKKDNHLTRSRVF